MNTASLKDALRARMKNARKSLPGPARRRAAERLRDEVCALGLPGPVLIYVSVRGELGTRLLIHALDEVAVPRIVGPDLEARRLTGLVPGGFGVPTSDGPKVVPGAVVVPGLAFDERGGRLGYGGGFYDRFLAAHPHVVTVGVGYDFQVVEEVPLEPHDVRLDRVLTVSSAP